ncbi:flavodoxin family protein [Methanobacterium aggregans]|uniref:flavodoxin family protein n=1 Tax=Methanobacterium aggregans TaxID=1615586 RepID=UPI001AEA2E60|nr:hypothetical protein [Methanobacterium aggregans]MBP2045727.1 flavodoxin [Methanobacterium aggregans]
MGILKIIGIVLAIIMVAAAGVWLFSLSGSYAAETLKPDGAVTGKALIVYDPGLSGNTKNVASSMANDLKAKGYEVVLAGPKSSDASKLSGYSILMVGSPTYGGKPSGTINSYLEGLNLPENITVGVYSTGGTDNNDSNQFMADILKKSSVRVEVSEKFGSSADKVEYSNFVSQILT